MKKLIIVGAGGYGREVMQWAQDAGYDCGEWRIEGFLDDNPDVLGGFPGIGKPILGGIGNYPIGPYDYFACGLGLPKIKKACVEKLLARGARFVSVVHPSAAVGRNVRLGTGCVICPGAVLTVDIELGDFVLMNCQSTVGHDARLGRWCTVSGHGEVTGHVELGEGVMLGSHAAIIPGVKIGDWAVIGAGAVAFRTVPPGVTVVGVPAHPLAVPVRPL